MITLAFWTFISSDCVTNNFWCQLQGLQYLLAHQMEVISLEYILLGIQCQGYPCHLFLVVLNLSHMLFLLVELYMDLLGQFLMSQVQVVVVLVLGVVILVLLLATITHTSKAHNSPLVILDLLLTFRPWKIPTASHLLVLHYLNLGLPMSLHFFLEPMHWFVFYCCRLILTIFCMYQMPAQGTSQSFRDQFSVAGMSQVLLLVIE